jgi:surface protein
VALIEPNETPPPLPSPMLVPVQEHLNIVNTGSQEHTVLFASADEGMTEADIYVWRMTDTGDFVGPVKVEVREESNQDINFEVHSVTHGGEGIVEFYMTVEAPTMVSYAMVPAGSQPPQNGTSSFSLDYAGTQTRGVEIYGGYDDSIDYDIYIWVYDAEGNPVGPVKVLLAAYGSGTGDGDSGTGDGGYEHEGVIPEGYTLATDEDFSGTRDGEFRYIGSNPYVVVPHVIKGVSVTSYSYMFAYPGVKGVASDNPNITDMSSMFANSTSETLDLTYLDTSNVVNMSDMFYGSQATSLDLSSFDTSNVTDMCGMFYGSQATSLDLSNFDTSNVTDMGGMFRNSAATSLDLSSFDTSNVTGMYGMNAMFSGSKATTLDLSSFDTSNLTGLREMFKDSVATIIDISSFDTSSVVNMNEMFTGALATTVYVRSQADIDRIQSLHGVGVEIPETLNFYVKGYEPPEPSEPPEGPEWVLATDSDFNGFTDGAFTYKGTAEYVIIPDKIKYMNVTSYANMFKGTAVKGVKSTNPNVTDMSGMFEDSTAESLDLSGLNTSGVTNMRGMFKNSAATTLDLSNFDTSNVTTMREMFSFSNATVLDLSSFDLSKVTVTISMLSGAKATTGYARTTVDANKLNSVSGKPLALNFVVK